MMRPIAALALSGALGLALLAAPAAPQAASAPPSKDPAAAAAGTYRLDPRHTTVMARIGHGNGMSFSTFRFGTTAGTLTWNPAQLEAAKVEVTVDPKSIMTPVAGFGEELSGDKFLNAAKFPEVKFTSSSIRRTGPTTGEIAGSLTLMGQTKPVVIAAELVGAGNDARGIPTIGFKGSTKFKRSDFGFGAMVPMIADEVEILIDTEFNRQG